MKTLFLALCVCLLTLTLCQRTTAQMHPNSSPPPPTQSQVQTWAYQDFAGYGINTPAQWQALNPTQQTVIEGEVYGELIAQGASPSETNTAISTCTYYFAKDMLIPLIGFGALLKLAARKKSPRPHG